MRITVALTLICSVLIASQLLAQSDAPPIPRFVQKHDADAPPPSRPLKSDSKNSGGKKSSLTQVQFSEPVPAPPVEFPVRDLELLVPRKEEAKVEKLPLLAPSSMKKTTEYEISGQNEAVKVESHPQPAFITTRKEITESPVWRSEKKRREFQNRGTWVPVNKEREDLPEPQFLPGIGPEPTPTLAVKPDQYDSVQRNIEQVQRETLQGETEFVERPIAPPPPLPDLPSVQTAQVAPSGLPQHMTPYEPPPLEFDDAGGVPVFEEFPIGAEPQFTDPMFCEDCWYRGDICADGCDSIAYAHISPLIQLGLKGGNDRSISEVQALLPLIQNDIDFLFADIQGRFDDREASEGEFGLGYRTYLSDDWILGVYAYYDLLKTSERNRFNQFTTGIEFLSEDWDIRLNGYFPNEGGKPSSKASGISNGTIISNAYVERAATGFNLEVGKRLLHWGHYDSNEVRWFVGYYHLENDAPGFREISGPATRLEYRCYDLSWLGEQSRLTAGIEASTDDVRDEQYWGYLRVQIPFSPKWSRKKLDPLRRRFVDRPMRHVD